MDDNIVGLIAAVVMVTAAYWIYHGIGLYLIKHIRPRKVSRTFAIGYGVLFPGVSHQYPLSYQKLHRLRVSVNPVSLAVPLYIAFVLLFCESISNQSVRLFSLIALILFPYLLSLWRTSKLSGALIQIQSLESLLDKKQENLDRLSSLRKEAWEQIKLADTEKQAEKRKLSRELSNILAENRKLKEQIRKNENAEKILAREMEREKRKLNNIEILKDCAQQGKELGIDSNVLMECDDDFFEHLKRNQLVVSKFVHQEWDRLKVHDDYDVKRKARVAMHRFELLQKEGNTRTIIKQWDHAFLKANALLDKHGDESIIADYLYENKEKNREIHAVSFDTGFRTSARGAGLPVLDISK